MVLLGIGYNYVSGAMLGLIVIVLLQLCSKDIRSWNQFMCKDKAKENVAVSDHSLTDSGKRTNERQDQQDIVQPVKAT